MPPSLGWNKGNLLDHIERLEKRYGIDASEFMFVKPSQIQEGDKIYMSLWENEVDFLGYIITRPEMTPEYKAHIEEIKVNAEAKLTRRELDKMDWQRYLNSDNHMNWRQTNDYLPPRL